MLDLTKIVSKDTNICLSVKTRYVEHSVIVLESVHKCETVAMSLNQRWTANGNINYVSIEQLNKKRFQILCQIMETYH